MSKAAEALAKAICAQVDWVAEPDIVAMTRLIDSHPDVKGLVEAANKIANGSWMSYYDGGSVGECTFCHKPDFGLHDIDCEWAVLKQARANWLPSPEKRDE